MMWARATAGANATWAASSFITIPTWLKLVRVGNVFTGYASSDGVTWTMISSSSVSMASTIYFGMAICANNLSSLAPDAYDHVSAP